MRDSELLRVTDYYQISLLTSLGIRPSKTEYDGHRFACIYTKHKAQKVLDKFYLGKLEVNARDLIGSIKLTKDQIFSMERQAKES